MPSPPNHPSSPTNRPSSPSTFRHGPSQDVFRHGPAEDGAPASPNAQGEAAAVEQQQSEDLAAKRRKNSEDLAVTRAKAKGRAKKKTEEIKTKALKAAEAVSTGSSLVEAELRVRAADEIGAIVFTDAVAMATAAVAAEVVANLLHGNATLPRKVEREQLLAQEAAQISAALTAARTARTARKDTATSPDGGLKFSSQKSGSPTRLKARTVRTSPPQKESNDVTRATLASTSPSKDAEAEISLATAAGTSDATPDPPRGEASPTRVGSPTRQGSPTRRGPPTRQWSGASLPPRPPPPPPPDSPVQLESPPRDASPPEGEGVTLFGWMAGFSAPPHDDAPLSPYAHPATAKSSPAFDDTAVQIVGV